MDTRSPEAPDPPETPGVLWVGKSQELEASSPVSPKPVVSFAEQKAGIRIAKILSQLTKGHAPPKGGAVGLPHKAMIEVSSACNLRCTLCPVGQTMKKRMSLMKPEIFTRLIDRIASTVWKAKLYNYGEPLLHPQLPQFIEYAKSSGIEWVEISTNGMLLTPEVSSRLITAGLDFLRISIDGIDQATYALYRKGGDVNQLWANLGKFRQLRDEKFKSRPIVEVQCLATRDTEDRMNEMMQLALGLGADRFRVKTFNAYMSGEEKAELGRTFLPQNKQLSRYSDYGKLTYRDQFKLSSCLWPRERLTVNTDGTVVPCCYDFNAEHALGTFDSDREDGWWTPERQQFIKQLENSPLSIGMCARCPVGVPDLTADRI